MKRSSSFSNFYSSWRKTLFFAGEGEWQITYIAVVLVFKWTKIVWHGNTLVSHCLSEVHKGNQLWRLVSIKNTSARKKLITKQRTLNSSALVIIMRTAVLVFLSIFSTLCQCQSKSQETNEQKDSSSLLFAVSFASRYLWQSLHQGNW